MSRATVFTRTSVRAYVAFCVLTVGGALLKSWTGLEVFDLLGLAGWLWPVPLFLSLLRPFQESPAVVVAAYVGGLGLVALASLGAERVVGTWPTRVRVGLGLVAWYVPLFVVQLLAMGVALACGMEVAE